MLKIKTKLYSHHLSPKLKDKYLTETTVEI